MSIAIVTDSTADLPQEITRKLNIHVVPNILIIEGEEYKDGVDISRREFYERLPHLKIPPTTATASSGTYNNLYKGLFGQGFQHIISIHVSKQFSGVFNAASIGAEPFGDKIHVVDSEQVTMGQGFQVHDAALAAKEEDSVHLIVKRLDELRLRIRIFAMLEKAVRPPTRPSNPSTGNSRLASRSIRKNG